MERSTGGIGRGGKDMQRVAAHRATEGAVEQNWLQQIAADLPQMVWTARADGSCDQFNRHWYDYTGLTKAQALGQGWQAALHPADLLDCLQRWDASVATASSFEIELRLRRCDGVFRWHLCRAVPQRGPDDRVTRWVGIFTDIHGVKWAEDALRESNACLQSVVMATPIVLFTLDLEGVFTLSQGKGLNPLGLKPGQVVGQSVFQLYRDSPDILDACCRALSGEYVVAVTRESGHVFENILSPQWDANGQVCGVLGVATDITERTKAEASLRESEERYRGLVDHSPEAIIAYSEDRFVYVNAAALSLFGAATPGDLLGRSIFEVVAPDFQDLARERARRSQHEGRTSPLTEQKYVRLDGTVIDVEAVSTPITWDGRPAGQVLIRNITERKRSEAALHRAQEELEARVEARTAELAMVNLSLQEEIIERQWAEVEMQRVLGQSEQMLASITSILIGVDREDCITIWNAAARRAFGVTTDEALGRPLGDCAISWDWAAVSQAATECKETQHATRVDNVRYVRDGQECFLGITLNPIGGYSDVPTGFLLLAADITERRQSEEALRASEARLRRVSDDLAGSNATLQRNNSVLQAQQEAAPDGILIVDENRKIVGYNQRLCELWHTPDEIIQSGDDEKHLSYALSLMKQPEEFLERVLYLYDHPQESSHDEIEMRDGRILDRYSGPVRSGAGQNFGRVWYFRDVTERKLLESHLSQSQKLESIGQLAAGIAHELNTPIQYVGDNTRFLKDAFHDMGALLQAYSTLVAAVRNGEGVSAALADADAAAAAADLEYLKGEIPLAISQSLDGVDRVAHIVRAMKEFSHPGTAQKMAVDLNQSIESTITVARNEWKYVAELHTEFDPSLPPVPCLPSELNQVFLNILVNAAHAISDVVANTAHKGCITVTTRAVPPEAPTHAEVRIQDTGTGMAPEIRTRIFDPFFTTKGVGRGTGQGLAISHAIVVDKHGGSIGCESEASLGTTFIIRLPLEGVVT